MIRTTGRIAALALAVAAALSLAPLARRGGAADDKAFEAAKKSLEQAVAARDPARVKDAIHAVAADDSERAAKYLLTVAFAVKEMNLYDDMVAALRTMGSADALGFLTKQARGHKEWSVRYLLVEAVGGMDHPEAVPTLVEALSDKHEAVQTIALRVARDRRRKELIDPLIAFLSRLEKEKKGDSRLHIEGGEALKGITGMDFETAVDWANWWKANRDAFDPAALKKPAADDESKHTVIRRLQRRGEKQFIEELAKGDILCVSGIYDHVDVVLTQLGLPFTAVEHAKFGQAKLDPNQVVILNCHDHEAADRFKPEDHARIREFVERGGYLFTSDWELKEAIEPCFGGFVGVGTSTEQHEFKIVPGKGADNHPLLRDVFPLNPFQRDRFKWKIDAVSYTVAVRAKEPNAVAVLVESPELGAKYGSPIVACYFRPGKGAVLHVLSHFEKQQDEGGDGFALQQLLANFVVEKQKFRRAQINAGKGGKKGGKP